MAGLTNGLPSYTGTGDLGVAPYLYHNIETRLGDVLNHDVQPCGVVIGNIPQGKSRRHRRLAAERFRECYAGAVFAITAAAPHRAIIFEIREQQQVALLDAQHVISKTLHPITRSKPFGQHIRRSGKFWFKK